MATITSADSFRYLSFCALRGPCFEVPVGKGLCWREAEKKSLEELYEASAWWHSYTNTQKALGLGQPNKQVILLHGPTASGKRTLLRAFEHSVEEHGGLFLTIYGTKPSAYCHPLNEMFLSLVNFVGKILNECNEDMKQRIIMRASRYKGSERLIRELCTGIPEMAKLFGMHLDSTSTSETLDLPNSKNSEVDQLSPFFRFSFLEFIRMLSDPQYPLVLSLENLPGISEATLDVLHSVVRDESHQGILIVGSYADDITKYSSSASQVQSFVQKWSECEAQIQRIALKPIQHETDLQHLLRRILGPLPNIDSLTDLVHEKCAGNLLCIDQFLFWLKQKGALTKNLETNSWKHFDDEETHGVLEAISSAMPHLSSKCNELFKLIVCLGPKVDIELANSLGDPSILNSLLDDLTMTGFLVRDHGMIYFAHEFVQEFFYFAMEDEEKYLLHYRLAKTLWVKVDPNIPDERLLFCITHHLKLGQQHIKSRREKTAIARLCLFAAQLSVKNLTFVTAAEYLEFGVSMLGEDSWIEDYETCLELYSASAEIALCMRQFHDVDTLPDKIIDHACRYSDTLQARCAIIYRLGASGKPYEAVTYGCEVLSHLGVDLPMHPSSWQALRVMKKTNMLLKGKSIEQIQRLPPMTEHEKLHALKVMTILFSFSFIVNPFISTFIAYEVIRLTLSHGLSAISSFGFVVHGAILSRLPRRADEGYRYGRLAIAILSQYPVDIWCGRVNAIFYAGIFGYRFPFRDMIRDLQRASQQCLLVGDKEFGMRCANAFVTCQIDIISIPELAKLVGRIRCDMRFYGDRHNLTLMTPLLYSLSKLSGRTDGEFSFFEKAQGLAEEFHSMDKSSGVQKWAAYSLMMVAYMFGNFTEASVHCKSSKGALDRIMGAGDTTVFFLFDGLTNLALARNCIGVKRWRYIRKAKESIRSLKYFASVAPLNFLHKVHLLEAELAAIRGDHVTAYAKYATSISLAKNSGLFVGTALAQERAGKYFLGRQDDEWASKFLSAAIVRYAEYGADAKVRHLREEMANHGKLHLIGSPQD